MHTIHTIHTINPINTINAINKDMWMLFLFFRPTFIILRDVIGFYLIDFNTIRCIGQWLVKYFLVEKKIGILTQHRLLAASRDIPIIHLHHTKRTLNQSSPTLTKA